MNKEEAEKLIEEKNSILDENINLLLGEEEVEETKNIMDIFVSPYELTFDKKSKNWKFLFGGNPTTMDISESGIVDLIFQQREISMDDIFKIKVEALQTKKGGNIKTNYKVIQVLEYKKAVKQLELFDNLEEKQE
jgi:hypothetical protein